MYLFFLQDYFLEIKKQNLEDFDTWSILQKKKKKKTLILVHDENILLALGG